MRKPREAHVLRLVDVMAIVIDHLVVSDRVLNHGQIECTLEYHCHFCDHTQVPHAASTRIKNFAVQSFVRSDNLSSFYYYLKYNANEKI